MIKKINTFFLLMALVVGSMLFITPVESAGKYHCDCANGCEVFDKPDNGAPVQCRQGCAGPIDGDCKGFKPDSPAPTQSSSKCGPCPTGYVCLCNPLSGNPTTVPQVLGRVIQGAMGVIGSLALLMFVYGGFQWLTSAGNSDGVKKGTQTMMWAVIGIVLVFSSYLLLDTFIQYLTGQAK